MTVRPWTFSRPQAGETTNRPLTTIRGEKRSNGRQKWGSVGQWLTPSGDARNRLHGPESILELSSEAKTWPDAEKVRKALQAEETALIHMA